VSFFAFPMRPAKPGLSCSLSGVSRVHRDAGLALTDPLGLSLEQRKNFLLVRDGLPPQHAAADLVDLALGIAQREVDLL
jgi:hypothetical protein